MSRAFVRMRTKKRYGYTRREEANNYTVVIHTVLAVEVKVMDVINTGFQRQVWQI